MCIIFSFFRGLKALGVRDLTYRLAFLACSVQATNPRVGNTVVWLFYVMMNTVFNLVLTNNWVFMACSLEVKILMVMT